MIRDDKNINIMVLLNSIHVDDIYVFIYKFIYLFILYICCVPAKLHNLIYLPDSVDSTLDRTGERNWLGLMSSHSQYF